MNAIRSAVFISNYFTHHQKPLSDALAAALGGDYLFIETSAMDGERIAQGWEMSCSPKYVVSQKLFEKQRETYLERIRLADVVIYGAAPLSLVKERIRNNQLVFRYAERPLKKRQRWKDPMRFIKWHARGEKRSNVFLLCASAYTASDFAKFFLFRNRAYNWGYFPELKRYDDIDSIIDKKRPASILWVARFIDWKHPEIPVRIAHRLKDEGYTFQMDLIGIGEMHKSIAQMILKSDLQDCVRLLGSMTPEEVRSHMEQAQIFLFTSDRQEGWGAVLNEAMNSGCAVVANREIGSVPSLLQQGKNGLIYDDEQQAFDMVRGLLAQPERCRPLGGAAYRDIIQLWNADVAAERLLRLAEAVKTRGNCQLYAEGPCSKAEGMKSRLARSSKARVFLKKVHMWWMIYALCMFLVNHVFAGTRRSFFPIKRRLLNMVGYEIGENTKVVGPLHSTGRLRVGKNCWINKNMSIHGNGCVEIGDNCDIAPDVTFLTGGHAIGGPERRADKGESYSIAVGDGCWIGARSTLLNNTSIGDGCVIAACSCVHKSIPEQALAGGVPARIIRHL